MRRTLSCSLCPMSQSRYVKGKTWLRHMRRVHGLDEREIRLKKYWTIIHIPIQWDTTGRRKLIHV